MTRSLGNTIADSLQCSLGYAERLLKGVPDAECARFARISEKVISSNHPAFIYGHLSLYAPRVLEQLERVTPAISDHFQRVFSKDANCIDDPDGTIYPPMAEITNYFRVGHQTLVEALRSTSDTLFQKPNPAEGRMAELFPTLGSLHNFYCSGHLMVHLGQMSAWRRMYGLGSA